MSYILCGLWGMVTAFMGFPVLDAKTGTFSPGNMLIVFLGSVVIVLVCDRFKKN
jgi:uncharacterized membrane protein YeaQ/YmgE (transglycosylase-associated protein family)